MSLRNQNWISFGGEPVTGRTPTRLRIMNTDGNTEMNAQQQGFVAHAYKLFCDAINVSPHRDGYFVQSRVGTDGTKVRMESNLGVHTVKVWVGGKKKEVEGLVFFGIPFDESYLYDRDRETWYTTQYPKTDKRITILDSLKRANNAYMYPKSSDEEKRKPSHPGNQTWFAYTPEDPHRFRDYVLSWWGQSCRYNASTKQKAMWAQYIWGRAMHGNVASGTVVPGISNVTPPEVSITRATFDATGYVSPNEASDEFEPGGHFWINGTRYFADGHNIMSACLGIRIIDNVETEVVRLTCSDTGLYPEYLAEVSLSKVLGPAKASGEIKYDDFKTYNITRPTGYIWDGVVHPPYWNADGNEAMCILMAFPTGTQRNVTLLCKLQATAEAGHPFDEEPAVLTKMEASTTYSSAGRNLSFSGTNQETSSLLSRSLNDNHSASSAAGGTYILAADYRGNEPVILRASIAEVGSATSTAQATSSSTASGSSTTVTDTVTWSALNEPLTGTVQISGTNRTNTSALTSSGTMSITTTVTVTSTLTLNGQTIDQDTHNYSESITSSTSYSAAYDRTRTARLAPSTLWYNAGRAQIYTQHYAFDDVATVTRNGSASNQITVTQSGTAGLWAIVGGDLRGQTLVLQRSGWNYRLPQVWNAPRSLSFTKKSTAFRSNFTLATGRSTSFNGTDETTDNRWLANPGTSTKEAERQATFTYSDSAEGFILPSDTEALVAFNPVNGVYISEVLHARRVKTAGTGVFTSATAIAPAQNFAESFSMSYAGNLYANPGYVAWPDITSAGTFVGEFQGDYYIEGNSNFKIDNGFAFLRGINATLTGEDGTLYSITTSAVSAPFLPSIPYGYAFVPTNQTDGSTSSQITPSGASPVEGKVSPTPDPEPNRVSTDSYFGGGGTHYCVTAGSAVSLDGTYTYVGHFLEPYVSSQTGAEVDHTTDLWFCNGEKFTPGAPYPKNGFQKMFSSPLFIGPVKKTEKTK